MLTPTQISSISAKVGLPSSGAAPATPAFNPSAPAPAPIAAAPAQNTASGNNILSEVGSTIKSGWDQATGAETNSIEGKENPLEAGTDIASGIATIASSPLAPIFKPLTDYISKVGAGDPSAGPLGEIINNITNSPAFQKFAESGTGKALATGAKVTGNLANVAGTVEGIEGMIEGVPKVGETLDKIKENFTPKEEPPGGGSGNTTAAEVIKNPLTLKEQELAFKQGRTTMENGKATVTPTPREASMQSEVQKLMDEGKVTAEKDPLTGNIKGETQIKNGEAVANEIKTTAQKVRSEMQSLDKQDIADGKITLDKNGKATKGIWSDSELVKQLYQTEDPLSIKSTDALTENLDNSVYRLAHDAPKTREGLLDLRQDFDGLVRKDYPNLYNGDMTPTRIKIQNMRENLNAFTEQQLPEDSTFRADLMKQHYLLIAHRFGRNSMKKRLLARLVRPRIH